MSCVQSLDQIIDQFHAMDSLPRMTKEEQQRFEEKPTLMTALLITCDFVYQELEEEQLKQDCIKKETQNKKFFQGFICYICMFLLI